MNCIFCQREMRFVGDVFFDVLTNSYSKLYSCGETDCLVFGDFPRYQETVDGYGDIIYQEYALDSLYVKVFPRATLIYKMKSYLLTDEVRIPRPIWINPTNTDETLDKLKLMITFS